MSFFRDRPFKTLAPCFLFIGCVSIGRGEPVRYERIDRTEPVALHIHVLRVDLQHPDVTLHAAIGPRPPPDGDGEVLMTAPLQLAAEHDLDWAINTNPWRHPERGERFPTQTNAPAIITGWAVSNGDVRSEPRNGLWEFWIDATGKAHIGNINQDAPEIPDVRLAVGGFQGLLREGEVLPTNPDGGRAPRSALGLDREGRILTMVVVDKGLPAGAPDWREVMNHYELALLMRDLECWNAYNLDGGGSSIMIRQVEVQPGQPLWIPVNRQSLLAQRPLPMLLGVRHRGGPAGEGRCAMRAPSFRAPSETRNRNVPGT